MVLYKAITLAIIAASFCEAWNPRRHNPNMKLKEPEPDDAKTIDSDDEEELPSGPIELAEIIIDNIEKEDLITAPDDSEL